jgi:hypothetical protein
MPADPHHRTIGGVFWWQRTPGEIVSEIGLTETQYNAALFELVNEHGFPHEDVSWVRVSGPDEHGLYDIEVRFKPSQE